jgi:transposase
MDQVKAIIETYLATQSVKATARRLKTSKNTVKGYIRQCQEHTSDLASLLKLDDDSLARIIYPPEAQSESTRDDVFSQRVPYWIKELRRVGVTRYLLWEEYRQEYPDGYGYSQFCERLKKEFVRRDLTLSLNHVPGERLMADFAGSKLSWVDAGTGEVHVCEVLVCVFPHSQYTFVIALPSQCIGDFVHGLNQALLYFGALPKVILSDNLKSYVTRTDRYDPKFTQLCEQLGAHYQFDLQATRVAKPKDKASVENAVSTAYSRVYAPMRNKVFHSLRALNEGICKQLALHNAKPYQKKAGSRKEIFEQHELPLMRSLPSELFEVKKITHAKVQNNYHVFLGEEKNFYSVPYQYAGEHTEVVYTSRVVEVYLKGKRIAIHERLPGRGTYFYQTKDTHMPRHHREWKEAQGQDAVYFLEQAQEIGPATCWAIESVLLSRIYQEQAYNSCRAIFRLGKTYTVQRLEKACERCQKAGRANYSMIKRILSLKLDQAPPQEEHPGLPEHDNIRGAQAYQ